MGEAADFRLLAGPIEIEYVREWKASGRPVVGFFCAHTPEELLWAAGILPVRLRGAGGGDTSHGDPYLGPFNARIAVKTFAERTVKLAPEQLAAEHLPALLEGLRPMLNTLAGRQTTESVLDQIRRGVR